MNLFSLAGWSWLWEIINGLMLIICNCIYVVITWLYQVFMAVAKVNLFSPEIFRELTSRMYIVIAIAMLFIFAYNIILMIINPDDRKSTGQATKLVKETVISFVLIILLPTIFNWLYVFQNNILDSQIIGTIILGGIGSSSSDSSSCDPNDYDCTCDFSGYGLDVYITDDDWFFDDYTDVEGELMRKCEDYKDLKSSERGAYMIAPLLMSSFYKPKYYTFEECVRYLQGETSLITDTESQKVCVNYFFDVTASRYTGDVSAFVDDTYLRQIVSDSDYDILEFNWLLAIVAGLIGAYMFFCYAMEIGVRVAKLGVLQIISPIPVMMRIIPKQKEAVYDKWFKHLVNTYVDVFIRLAIIFFALFAISLVPDVLDALWAGLGASYASSGGGFSGFFIKTLATVFVILGILKFAQDAPGLIKEFFGNGAGNFSLKSPATQLKENKNLMGGIGMAGTMGNRMLNKAGNYARIAKDKDKTGWQKFGAMAKNTGSMLNPYGYYKAGKAGYQATKDGKNVLEGINKSSAENLTKPGFMYRAKRTVEDAWTQAKHFATTDYMKNSDELKGRIKVEQLIVEAEKGMLDVLDKDKRVENMNNYYEELKKKAAAKGDFATRDALEKRRKADVDALKAAILKEKRTGAVASIQQDARTKEFTIGNGEVDMSKMDAEFNANFDKLARVLNENFATVNDILRESNKSEIASRDELTRLFTEYSTENFASLDDLKKVSEKQLESHRVELSQIEALKQGKKD